ncbi:MoaB/Mog domain-containing protein [Podospora fimiseda]|uniref:MoaB/Mog domain-containing protein n=1 Tax=Podospora fimiseda TaxID=252190 RepID=A0AAN7GX83_9PEZI|nr:MoaB/Mog domain-containing protein [Podospora fimiseda]
MYNRLHHVAKHLTRPGGGHSSAAAFARSKKIHTAACLIIGDEVLGGKTQDTNSHYVAKWCFGLGISLKKVEVIEDDESAIVEAVRQMSKTYDFVVTSGGIGPTHDDITYSSIAKAFDLPLKVHPEAYELMKKLSRDKKFNWNEDSPARKAKMRMVELPTDSTKPLEEQFIFPCTDLWVPVAVVNGNIHILPGVPKLFQKLLDGLTPVIRPRLDGVETFRVAIKTPLPESAVAPYLTELQEKVKSKDVKVGSYPHWGKKHNTVTLVGKDKAFLDSITPEVIKNVQGRLVDPVKTENEAEDDTSNTQKQPSQVVVESESKAEQTDK